MNAVACNPLPEVRSRAGRTAADVLAEGPRRQALPGFDPGYRDIVDCIARCTHRIREQKDIGLCRTHCADSCVMPTSNGLSCGVENVVQDTVSAFRRVIFSLMRPGVAATGLFSVRLTCNGFMPRPARNRARKATIPSATTGATAAASRIQGAVNG